MMGMEKMIASMIGKTPEEMRAISEQVTTAIFESARLVAEIHAGMIEIKSRLETLECQSKPETKAARSQRTPAS